MRDGARRVAVVLAGGDPVPAAVAAALPRADVVIAADSGLHQALGLGLAVDAIVGDFDSAEADLVAEARRAGARLERHPAEKDATDLELALDAAVREGATEIQVVGGDGGRLDHFAANLLLVGSPVYRAQRLRAHIGDATVLAVHGGTGTHELSGRPGSLCTLLAVGGPARGVVTAGLRYPLRDETLEPGSSRGVSNELTGDRATVALREGTLLAVQPGAITTVGGDA
jgi:thiamine pyrophosphokinase